MFARDTRSRATAAVAIALSACAATASAGTTLNPGGRNASFERVDVFLDTADQSAIRNPSFGFRQLPYRTRMSGLEQAPSDPRFAGVTANATLDLTETEFDMTFQLGTDRGIMKYWGTEYFAVSENVPYDFAGGMTMANCQGSTTVSLTDLTSGVEKFYSSSAGALPNYDGDLEAGHEYAFLHFSSFYPSGSGASGTASLNLAIGGIAAAALPEPSMGLVGMALVGGLGMVRRRRLVG